MSNGSQGAVGTLLIAGTPLGNVDDVSSRLRSAIATATIVAAEDTRRFRRLVASLGLSCTARVVSYYEQNEQHRTVELIAALIAGNQVLLVTDAGMPSVSDPGYRMVAAAIEAQIPVTCLPGPSAVTTALALSGLPSDRFCFEGFLPRKAGERRRALADLAVERRTMVFFEAPHRIGPMIEACAQMFGPARRAAICRELTKTYEEVRRGSLGELVSWANGEVRGEITVVIEGAAMAPTQLSEIEISALVADEVQRGRSKKDAVLLVATTTGMQRRAVFDAFHRKEALPKD